MKKTESGVPGQERPLDGVVVWQETVAQRKLKETYNALAQPQTVKNSVIDAMILKEVRKAIETLMPALLEGTINEMVLHRLADLEEQVHDLMEAVDDLENTSEELEFRTGKT